MMKKTSLLSLLFLLAFCKLGHAQNYYYPLNISLGIGTAKMSSTMSSNFEIGSSPSFTVKKIEKPGYSMYLDYALGDVISIGGSFNFNKADLILNENLANQTTYNGTCVAMGMRFLFHLKGKNTNKFDPYLSTGYSLMMWGYDSKDVVAAGALATKINSMIPFTFGCRYYINDHFGIGTELSTSRASRLSLGLNVRL
jgi:hypothetical protein